MLMFALLIELKILVLRHCLGLFSTLEKTQADHLCLEHFEKVLVVFLTFLKDTPGLLKRGVELCLQLVGAGCNLPKSAV